MISGNNCFADNERQRQQQQQPSRRSVEFKRRGTRSCPWGPAPGWRTSRTGIYKNQVRSLCGCLFICVCLFYAVCVACLFLHCLFFVLYIYSVCLCLCFCLTMSVCVWLCLSVSHCVYLCLIVSVCVWLCLTVSVCVCGCVWLCLTVSHCVCLRLCVSHCVCLCLSVFGCVSLCMFSGRNQSRGSQVRIPLWILPLSHHASLYSISSERCAVFVQSPEIRGGWAGAPIGGEWAWWSGSKPKVFTVFSVVPMALQSYRHLSTMSGNEGLQELSPHDDDHRDLDLPPVLQETVRLCHVSVVFWVWNLKNA